VKVKSGHLVAIVMLLILVGLFIYWDRSHSSANPCAASELKKSIGIELSVAIKDVEVAKGRLGISDDQTRFLDTFQKDFELRYEGACKDMQDLHSLSKSEYNCRRDKMDESLTKIRYFTEKITAAKALPDPAAQKEAILKALEDLESAAKLDYSSCSAAHLTIDTKDLNFGRHDARKFVKITNIGMTEATFGIVGVTEELDVDPVGGLISPGNTTPVKVCELGSANFTKHDITLHVKPGNESETKSDENYDLEIYIHIDGENAFLFDDLNNSTLSKASKRYEAELHYYNEVTWPGYLKQLDKYNLDSKAYEAAMHEYTLHPGGTKPQPPNKPDKPPEPDGLPEVQDAINAINENLVAKDGLATTDQVRSIIAAKILLRLGNPEQANLAIGNAVSGGLRVSSQPALVVLQEKIQDRLGLTGI
jgi:hypothetical protein